MANTGGLILPDGSERQLTAEFTIGRAEDNDLTIDKPTVVAQPRRGHGGR